MPANNLRYYLALAVILPIPANSAVDANDVIAECARISSTGDRILCLEEALRRLSPVDESTAMPGPDDADREPADTDSMSVAVDPESPPAVTAAAASLPGDARATAEIPATAESDSVSETADAQPELGAEQVARQNDVEEEQIRISATIVEHTLVGTGRLRLTLDNGQVWQQTGDDDDRVARRIRGDSDIAVEMWQSRSGGYRMHLLEVDRTLRVRRIR